MNQTSVQATRRGFFQILAVTSAYSALRPAFAFSPPLLQSETRAKTHEIIRLSSNENPYGPSPAALKAIGTAFDSVWRYPDEQAEVLIDLLTRLHSVGSENILLGNGSGEILKLAAAAFTGPDRRLVTADPTFEAISRHAKTARAEVVTIPLTADYRHDLAKVVDQSSLGLAYVCNPNNPTASITPKAEIRTFLSRTRSDTVVLIDEAYHHYVESNDYESATTLVRDYPNLIVARTFSKMYGMAGLRCGYCVANPGLISQLRSQQTWDSVNIMAIAAATASLPDKAHVEQGRRRNTEVKRYVYAELEKLGFKFIPSHANFLMIDLRRTARPVITQLREHSVEVGRVFSALPNFLRVTIGTRNQMERFLSAFREVMG